MITLTPNPSWLDGAVYDPSNRRKHTLNGEPIQSVTQTLKRSGKTGNFGKIPARVILHKAAIGTATHQAAWYYDQDDLDETTVAEVARLRLAAWKWFTATRLFTPILIEAVVLSRRGRYIGRLDRFGFVDRRLLVLLDLATGKPDAARKDLQTIAYLDALREQHPELNDVVIERWATELKPNGHYCIHRYPDPGRTDRMDRAEFREALAAAAAVGEGGAHV